MKIWEWSPISHDQAIRLERPFEEEEVRKAVLEMDRNKAPGPDGLCMTFFQESGDVRKDDLLRVFRDFPANGVARKSTNPTSITLIPKKD